MEELSRKAKIFVFTTILAGVLLAVWNLFWVEWLSLWLLASACLATIGQLFKVKSTDHQSSYNLSLLVYGFTFLLLGAPATLLVMLVAHLIEWPLRKYPWHIQSFNIAVNALAITGAGAVYKLSNPSLEPVTLQGTVGILIALVFFTSINHLWLGLMIWLTRGQSFNASGIFAVLSLAIDFTLISLGAATAMLWTITPAASIITLIPLHLIYTTLRVPALERETEIDPKIQIYNSRYFAKILEKEFSRAERFDRPLTVVLGDLDLLRNVNNNYGHLAGDVVLCGVAKILQESFRGYDVVARFGGEEFAIMLPETAPLQAYPRIEAIRVAIEAAEFEVQTSVTPIKVTISFGLAGRGGDCKTSDDIIHNADVALYEAKLSGRNATRVYTDTTVAALFGLEEEESSGSVRALKSPMVERIRVPYIVNPFRAKKPAKRNTPEKPVVLLGVKLKRTWLVNAYIGILMLIAYKLIALIYYPVANLDWYGLVAFALMVILTEGLSANLYARDTSVSTSAAPLIAGVLLYGPVGALLLSAVLATTAWIKNRGHLNRLCFDVANNLISSLIIAGSVSLMKASITSYHVSVQLALALLAGIIVFIINTALLSGVMSLTLGRSPRKLWKEEFRWLWPYYLALGASAFGMILGYSFAGLFGIVALILPVLTMRYSQIQYIEHTRDMVNQLRTNNVELEKQGQEISSLSEELLLTLATIIDLRDPYTLGHSKRVAEYAVLIAKELDLSKEQIDIIRKGALLHDIGKLGIPETILFKPGKLTNDEYQVIKQHTTHGAEIVESCHSLHSLIPIIRHHHERYDGRGYPDNLVGHQIPLEARIIGLADALEAMASDRVYRKGLGIQEIVDEITKNSGTQFSPSVVSAFLKVLRKEGEALIVNSGHVISEKKLPKLEATPLRVAPAEFQV
jgi:diguanylate cyclase (GGDEF)-like protein/putative nucleotidyltransferase with HDIG domain